jgi:hypothetical protein
MRIPNINKINQVKVLKLSKYFDERNTTLPNRKKEKLYNKVPRIGISPTTRNEIKQQADNDSNLIGVSGTAEITTDNIKQINRI